MSDFVDNHPLSRDFPELKNAFHELKANDGHIARKMEAYESVDKEIVRVEQGLEFRSDSELEALKLQRVHLKDAIYQAAVQHENDGTADS